MDPWHRGDNRIPYLPCAFPERRLNCIYDIDSDSNSIRATVAIRDRNGDRVRWLCFIVEGCFCLQLPICADDTKRVRIVATETIGECVLREEFPRVVRIRNPILIGCGDRRADVCAGGCILFNRACCVCTVTEDRRIIGIRDTDCNINRIAPTFAIRNRNGNGVGVVCFMV